MKKPLLCIILVVLTIVSFHANASGLFPSMDEMLGTSMPSVSLVIGRPADEQTDTDAGSEEVYLNFSGADYISFGQYLAGCGAVLKEHSSEDNTVTAIISVRNAEMTFSYNWVESTAVAIYPSGTRAETEKESDKSGENILPPAGGVMPSVEFAVGRKPDEQLGGVEGLIQIWNSFTVEEYTSFSAYLAETGATLKDNNIEAGVLNATIGFNGFFFQFVYNWNEQTVEVIYPNGTTPETNRWDTPVGNGFVLPDISSVGKELPRISVALEREPSSEETLQDGSLQETYLDFSEADYNTFSKYLQTAGCMLEDYHTDENGTLVINLGNGSGKMTFSYDAVRHIGIVTYPGQARLEKAWVATLVPESQATPKPTEKTDTKYYSESECWNKAEVYFRNLRWKNPKSVVIHGHSTTYNSGSYTFTIDYSAENGFGGTNRGYYWITVDWSTGEITMAFGND